MASIASPHRLAALAAAPLAALLAGGALAAAPEALPPLRLLLHASATGAQHGIDAWRQALDRTLAAAQPQPAAQVQSLRRIAPDLYAVQLACPSADACAAAPAQLAELNGWITSVAPDRAVRRPRTPTPGGPSAR